MLVQYGGKNTIQSLLSMLDINMRNLDTPVWSNDGECVCFMGRQISGADAATFEILLGSYARDKRSVFHGSFRSQKIDRNTFRVHNANFGVDSSCAYFKTFPLKLTDPKSFRVLDSSLTPGRKGPSGSFHDNGFAADTRAVWYCGSGRYRIKSADPVSFVSLGNGFGYDKERIYFEHSQIPGADRTTWRHWGQLLSVDKDSVFFTNKKIPGIDRRSVIRLEHDDCCMDRYRIFCGIKVISTKEYLALLKHREDACLFEKEWLQAGRLYERLLDEWPHPV